MEDKKEISDDQEYNRLVNSVTLTFQQIIKTMLAQDKIAFAGKDTKKLLRIKNPYELLKFIYTDEYWLKHFSAYLLNGLVSQLMHKVQEQPSQLISQ